MKTLWLRAIYTSRSVRKTRSFFILNSEPAALLLVRIERLTFCRIALFSLSLYIYILRLRDVRTTMNSYPFFVINL